MGIVVDRRLMGGWWKRYGGVNCRLKSLLFVALLVHTGNNFLVNTASSTTAAISSRKLTCSCAFVPTYVDRRSRQPINMLTTQYARRHKEHTKLIGLRMSPQDNHNNNEITSVAKETTDRRSLLQYLGYVTITNSFLSVKSNDVANAITMEYPDELSAPTNINDLRNADNRRLRKINEINQQQRKTQSSLLSLNSKSIVSSSVWGVALWFLTGSRSNPIATPLANVIYDKEQEVWLQDRNDGLFSNLPWEYYIILGVVFLVLGFGTDAIVNVLSDGDPSISIQLACVSLIGGASLELGRISSGGKKQTRSESDRSDQLLLEFEEFATNRLQTGGNCHRNEVVQAFRRYYSKYRQSDNVDYPLSDLEIEQLLRTYCRNKGIEMSPAGFYTGIQINVNADVFVKK